QLLQDRYLDCLRYARTWSQCGFTPRRSHGVASSPRWQSVPPARDAAFLRTPLPPATRAPGRGDVLHRIGWAVRLGGARRLGRAGRRAAAARGHAAALQRSRDAARGRAGVDAPGRGRLLPVGEAGVRPVLGLLERLAVVELLAARHGDLPGAPG